MGQSFPPDSLNGLLAATLKKLRVEKGLSQEELAMLASVDRTYISGIERARRNITIATLERLIPHLAASPGDFFRALCKMLDSEENQDSEGHEAQATLQAKLGQNLA